MVSRGSKVTTLGYAQELALTDKQAAFCQAYLVRMSVEDGVRAASITHGTAYSWLRMPACQSYIKSLIHERNVRTKVDADVLLLRLQAMMNADFSEIMEAGEFKDIEDWPPIWRQMVNGRKVDKDGNVSYTFIDRAKVLEMIGKHTDVGAWVERVVMEVGLAEGLAAARRRHLEKAAANAEKVINGVVTDITRNQPEAAVVSQEKPSET